MSIQQFQVSKRSLGEVRWVSSPAAAPADGEVRVRIETSAYTANNITYAAFGEAMHYWDFFPTGEPGWGCIPVWGFGVVEASRAEGVAEGERLWGFWPSASHAVLRPARVRAAGFVDGSPHRAPLHAVYNQLVRVAADPLHAAGTEDVQALLRPLFTTAWLLDDFVAEALAGRPAAGPLPRVLLSSASSKTAWATAAQLAARGGIECIGLTSPRQRAFCDSLGVYDRVLVYDELESVAPAGAALYLDFAGDAPLRQRVHAHLPQLEASIAIGGTHVEQLGGGQGLPGPRPTLFFAPAQVKKRIEDWGPAVFEQRLVEAWHALAARATAAGPGGEPWLRVRVHHAPQGLAALHAQVLAGQADARDGHVLHWPAPRPAA